MENGDRMTKIVRPLRGGQITIPAEFRKKLGITEDTVLRVSLEGQTLRIVPLETRASAPGTPWLKDLYDLFAPVREAAAHLSAGEINRAIDEAVRQSHERHA